MNLNTADFNWISLLIVIIGAVIGVVKSSKKRIGQESVFTFDDEYEEESENSVQTQDNGIEDLKYNREALDSNPRDSELNIAEASPVVTDSTNAEEEQEFEIKRQFDIRQAIISSEILNRPNF